MWSISFILLMKCDWIGYRIVNSDRFLFHCSFTMLSFVYCCYPSMNVICMSCVVFRLPGSQPWALKLNTCFCSLLLEVKLRYLRQCFRYLQGLQCEPSLFCNFNNFCIYQHGRVEILEMHQNKAELSETIF